MSLIPPTEEERVLEILKRLLADVDDDMEFAGTVFKSKDGAAQAVSRDLNKAKAALLALLAEARISALKPVDELIDTGLAQGKDSSLLLGELHTEIGRQLFNEYKLRQLGSIEK